MMDCRRSLAVDDDRSRRIRWVVDDDRRRRRWAVDDDQRRIAFYQTQVKASLDRMDILCVNFMEKIMSRSATIPASPSSRLSSTSRNHKQIHNQPTITDDHPPLDLPLRWRDPPDQQPIANVSHKSIIHDSSPLQLPLKWRNPLPDHLIHNQPTVVVCDSPPLQPHSVACDSAFTSSRDPDRNPDSLPSSTRTRLQIATKPEHETSLTRHSVDPDPLQCNPKVVVEPEEAVTDIIIIKEERFVGHILPPNPQLPIASSTFPPPDSPAFQMLQRNAAIEQSHAKSSPIVTEDTDSTSFCDKADDSNHRSYHDLRACTCFSSPEHSAPIPAPGEHSDLNRISSSSRRPDAVGIPDLNPLSDVQSQIHTQPECSTLLPPPNPSLSSLPLRSGDLKPTSTSVWIALPLPLSSHDLTPEPVLKATVKAFYEIIGERYPNSPNHPLNQSHEEVDSVSQMEEQDLRAAIAASLMDLSDFGTRNSDKDDINICDGLHALSFAEMNTNDVDVCGKAVGSTSGNIFSAGVKMSGLNSTDKAAPIQRSQAARCNITEGLDHKFVGPAYRGLLEDRQLVASTLGPLLKFCFHEEVRSTTISAMPKLLKSAKLTVEKGLAQGRGESYVKQLSDYIAHL